MTRESLRPNHLPDFRKLHGLLEYEDELVEEEVPVHLM